MLEPRISLTHNRTSAAIVRHVNPRVDNLSNQISDTSPTHGRGRSVRRAEFLGAVRPYCLPIRDKVVADLIDTRRCIFLAYLWRAELLIAHRFQTLIHQRSPCPVIDAARAIGWVEKKFGVTLAANQRAAVTGGSDSAFDQHYPMLWRNLVHTGITRGKRAAGAGGAAKSN